MSLTCLDHTLVIIYKQIHMLCIVVVIITMLYVQELKRDIDVITFVSIFSIRYVFHCHFSVLIRTIQSAFAPSEYFKASWHENMNIGRIRCHIRVGGKQCRFQRFIDDTSLPSICFVNVRWRFLVIIIPSATLHVSSQYIGLKIFSRWG